MKYHAQKKPVLGKEDGIFYFFFPAMERGLIHIYTGDGKGKTTCAVGLCVRAVGQGLNVLFVQFFKHNKTPSGEKETIQRFLPQIELIRSDVRHPMFDKTVTDRSLRTHILRTFETIKERLRHKAFDLLVLDEIMGVINGGWMRLDELLDFLEKKPPRLEVVLTGRDAPYELVRRADYVTEMLKIKHPYDSGTGARKGIEY